MWVDILTPKQVPWMYDKLKKWSSQAVVCIKVNAQTNRALRYRPLAGSRVSNDWYQLATKTRVGASCGYLESWRCVWRVRFRHWVRPNALAIMCGTLHVSTILWAFSRCVNSCLHHLLAFFLPFLLLSLFRLLWLPSYPLARFAFFAFKSQCRWYCRAKPKEQLFGPRRLLCLGDIEIRLFESRSSHVHVGVTSMTLT